MTRAKTAALGVAALVVMSAIGVGVFVLANTALGSAPKAPVAACTEAHNDYIVTIEAGQPSLDNISAKLCDKLTIVNADATIRLIAFGKHDQHQTYDGIEEKALAQGQSLSVTLNQAGTFTFHDHLDDSVTGTFTVQ